MGALRESPMADSRSSRRSSFTSLLLRKMRLVIRPTLTNGGGDCTKPSANIPEGCQLNKGNRFPVVRRSASSRHSSLHVLCVTASAPLAGCRGITHSHNSHTGGSRRGNSIRRFVLCWLFGAVAKEHSDVARREAPETASVVEILAAGGCVKPSRATP